VEPGHEPGHRAEDQRDRGGQDRDGQRRARAVDDAAEDVAPGVVRAEDVVLVRAGGGAELVESRRQNNSMGDRAAISLVAAGPLSSC
jgi:hypothetical protein